MSREEARKATTKPDGPNFKNSKSTIRPTDEEIKKGVPGTESFRLRNEDDRSGEGMFKGEEAGEGVRDTDTGKAKPTT
jgi:hypothetical protein